LARVTPEFKNWIYLVLYLVSTIFSFSYAAGNIVYLLLLKQRGKYLIGWTIYGAIQLVQLLVLNLIVFFTIVIKTRLGLVGLLEVFVIMMLSPLILIATFICQVIFSEIIFVLNINNLNIQSHT
jgi:hypothetical protein